MDLQYFKMDIRNPQCQQVGIATSSTLHNCSVTCQIRFASHLTPVSSYPPLMPISMEVWNFFNKVKPFLFIS